MKITTVFIVVIIFCFGCLYSQEKTAEIVQLTLKDCILKAMEDNLDIAVQTFDPEISSFSIIQQKEKYWPQFSIGYSNFNYNYLTNWAVQGSNYLDRTFRYNLALKQEIPTGGQIELSILSSSSDTTRALTLVNPSYRGELSLNFTQPLLKGFGPKINNMEIKKAQNQLDISVTGLKTNLIQKVYEVEEAYWNLVYYIENLKVYELTLNQNLERLKKVKEAERIGVKSPLEVLRTEAEVANYENSVLLAQTQIVTYQDRLKGILNFPIDAEVIQSIMPTDQPVLEKIDISFEEALKIAYSESPEIEKSQKEIENTKLDVSYQKNQLLPQLDLVAQLWFPGQSGDILVYKDGNPYTEEVIDRIEGTAIDSFKDVFDFKYKNWYVTLNLTIPMDTIFSRSSLAKAKLEEEKKLLEREKIEKEIYFNVLEAYKELQNREKTIETATRYRGLREKTLQAEEERYNLGLVGNEWLFEYQRQLANARVTEIKAIVDYKISVAKLERVLGINLKNKDIKFREYRF